MSIRISSLISVKQITNKIIHFRLNFFFNQNVIIAKNMIFCFWLLHLSPTLKHTYVLCFKVKKIRNTIAWFNANKFGKLICFSTFVFLHIFTLWRLLQSLLCSPYLYSSNILSKGVLKADSCMFSPSLSRLLSFRLLCNKLKIILLRLSTIDLLSPKLLSDFIHSFSWIWI